MMRRFGFGLVAALVTVTLAAATGAFAKDEVTAEARTAGMKAAPAIAQASGTGCAVADARLVGTGTDSTTFYEVACQDGSGYMFGTKPKATTPTTYPCVMFEPGPDGKPNTLACKLPGNANPAAGLKPLLTKAGHACNIEKGRYLGSSTDVDIYEVACTGTPGYIIQAPKTGAAATVINCLAVGTSGAVKCGLTTPEQQMAYLGSLASSGDSACTVKSQRYVGSTPDNSDYYEVACNSGKGYMLQVDANGKFLHATNCLNAASIGGGCTLGDYRQAMTQQNSLYSDLAKKVGFDCKVSQYADFPTANPDPEIVELACSNRPDGGVGVFSQKGPSRVYDCIRAQTEGYRCSFTQEAAVYPALSAQLKAKGRGSCVVSGARPYGKDANQSDLIEVACADGGPGWVMVYAANSQVPTDLLNCAQVASSGGCQLPTNKKH